MINKSAWKVVSELVRVCRTVTVVPICQPRMNQFMVPEHLCSRLHWASSVTKGERACFCLGCGEFRILRDVKHKLTTYWKPHDGGFKVPNGDQPRQGQLNICGSIWDPWGSFVALNLKNGIVFLSLCSSKPLVILIRPSLLQLLKHSCFSFFPLPSYSAASFTHQICGTVINTSIMG